MDVVLQTPFDKGFFGNDLLPAARRRPAGDSYYRKPLGIAGRAPLFWALRVRLALVANHLTWLVLASQSVKWGKTSPSFESPNHLQPDLVRRDPDLRYPEEELN